MTSYLQYVGRVPEMLLVSLGSEKTYKLTVLLRVPLRPAVSAKTRYDNVSDTLLRRN